MAEIAASALIGNVTPAVIVEKIIPTPTVIDIASSSPILLGGNDAARVQVHKSAPVQPVEMIKIEPGCVEIEVTTTPSDPPLIVPDSVAQAEENLEMSEPVPDPHNVVKVAAYQESFKPSTTSTPSVKTENNLLIRPSRNKLLTSNILSADEIAKEVLERAEKKRPQQLPEGGDLIFQKQITKRLAEKIVKEDSLNPNISLEMLAPPPAPKLPTLDTDHPDMDAQMLLQILEEGAESHYPEPAKPPRLPKFKRPEVDKELEKEMALKQLMEVSQSRKRRTTENNNISPKSDQKPKKRMKNEVQRLLQDEGAINMLYAIEKGEDTKATTLPSKRRMKKALMKKAQEVSQAILDGSTLSKGLRLRHPVDGKIKKEPEDPTDTKVKKEPLSQPDKITVIQDDSVKNSFVAPSPTPGASKIIRRHSSSSSYSGNNSPTRRISIDDIKSDSEAKKNIIENGVIHSENIIKSIKSPSKVLQNNSPSSSKPLNDKAKPSKLVKKLIKKSLNNSTIKSSKTASLNGTKGKKIVKTVKTKNNISAVKPTTKIVNSKDTSANSTATNESSESKHQSDVKRSEPVITNSNETENGPPKKLLTDLPDQNGFKEKLQNEFTNKLKTMMVRQGLLTKGESPKKVGMKASVQPNVITKPVVDKQLLTENKTITCEAIWQMLQDDWNMGDDPDDPPSPFEGPSFSDSASASLTLDIDLPKPLPMPLKNEIAPLPASEPELDVIPENKNEVPFSHHLGTNTFMYKELMLRKIGPLVHVNIAPVSTHLPQAFNVQVLKELTSVLESCGLDQRCRCLLLTSSGSLFSSGVDLPFLLASDSATRTNAAKTTAQAVKDFALKLGMFSKMVVAGVSGPCVGLGVAMLPLCDVVISSPRSVFLTPYSSLGYIPEAAATLTLPSIIGHRMASSMLIGGRKLTAQEALNCGLISQMLPEENFASQVLEAAFLIATQSAQSMESTKALMMHPIRSRLSTVLAMESALLQQHWITHDCQLRIRDKGEKLLNE